MLLRDQAKRVYHNHLLPLILTEDLAAMRRFAGIRRLVRALAAPLFLIAFLGASAPGQSYNINAFAGGGLPNNVAATPTYLAGASLYAGAGYLPNGYWSDGGVAVDGAGNAYFSSGNIVFRVDARTGLLTRIAGNGTFGYYGDNGPATQAALNSPNGVTVDAAGNVYIADTGNQVIRKVAGGLITTIAGNGLESPWGEGGTYSGDGGPATRAGLNNPTGVAVDAAGNVYIADTDNGVIRKVSNGVITTFFPGPGGELGSPCGVAVDAAGNVYIADVYRNVIRKVSNGVITTIAGTGSQGYSGDNGLATAAELDSPTGVAVDTAGNVYIADAGNRVVRKVSNGVITTFAGTGTAGYSGDNGPAAQAKLAYPAGVTVDAAGNVYISDVAGGAIRKVANSVITTIAGGPAIGCCYGDNGPAASAELSTPTGTAVDAAGNVYIADAGEGVIRKVSQGVITTIAGNGWQYWVYGDGNAPDLELVCPTGVAMDAAGNLYIADAGNNVIRKASNGAITTIAGTASDQGYSGDNGPATSSELNGPSGVAVDAAGNVYIADAGNSVIRKVSNGVITTIAGTGMPGYFGDYGPATEAMLYQPSGVAVDAAGNLYIADSGNNVIRKVSNGVITTMAGNGYGALDYETDSYLRFGGYTGDNGPATSAELNWPSGVAVDAAGNLYIADTGNNVVRKVSSGVITTIAGNGYGANDYFLTGFGRAGYSGDNGPATSAELNWPVGVSVDASGKVYIADTLNQVVRVLVPASATPPIQPVQLISCPSVTLLPATLQIGSDGGTLPLNVGTPVDACTWTLSGLPAWISASSAASSGSGSVTLTVAANPGAARSATLTVNGVTAIVSQAMNVAMCGFAIKPAIQAFPASGGTGSLAITSAAGCAWQLPTAPAWLAWSGTASGSGNGSVSFQVAANTGAARSFNLSVDSLTARIDQNGATLSSAGVMSHFATGGDWQTTFTLVNPGLLAAHAELDFFDQNGNAIAPQQTGTAAGNTGLINPAALLQLTAPATGTTTTGWANLLSDGGITGFGTFRLQTSTGIQEAVVRADNRNGRAFYLPFDNTGGDYYGVAISNLSSSDELIDVIVRDPVTGATVDTEQFFLGALSHTQFLLNQQFPATANLRGTAEFSSAGFFGTGDISVLGLRFTQGGAFTSVPVFAPSTAAVSSTPVNAGGIAHIAAGSGWSTEFTLINTGTAVAHARLNFFDDNGNALALPLSLPLTSGNPAQTATTLDQTIAPGAMLLIDSAALSSQAVQTGWAQLSTDGGVSGFAVFRSTTGAVTQEAAVPLFPATAGGSLLAFDNTNGYVNSVALANNSANAASVPVIIHDPATGNSLATDTIQLPAWGHTAFLLTDRYPATAATTGTIEFGVSAGQIGVLGVRVNSNGAITSVPQIFR
jgi:sugar lactone lactonase YvrE